MNNLNAPLGFLDRDKRYADEKPYALRYNPADDIPTENIVKKFVNDVEIHDIRSLPVPLSFDENGLTVQSIETRMVYEDWFRDEKVKNVFFPELRMNLEGLFGTPNIQIFEYKVRARILFFDVTLSSLNKDPPTQRDVSYSRWQQFGLGAAGQRCPYRYFHLLPPMECHVSYSI